MSQILFLHGGDSFMTYDDYISSLKTREINYDRLKYTPRWREWIATKLPNDDVLIPTMPNSFNAQYDEWVIYFEKILPFLKGDFTLVGHSLGGMFLAKYLHSTVLASPAQKIILVATRYGQGGLGENGSFAVETATGLDRSAKEVHLFHSQDDLVVPFEDIHKLHRDIPSAILHVFEDRGHFVEQTFPEMLDLLKQ